MQDRENAEIETGEAEGTTAFRGSITVTPDIPDVLFLQSQEMAASGRHAEALEALGKLLELEPQRLDALQTAGQIQSHLGKHGEAIETFRVAQNLAPDDENVAVSLIGQIMAVDGAASGVEPCDRFLEGHPKSVAVLYTRAHALAAAGRDEEALGSLKRVVELEPKNLDALLMMGQIQGQLGKRTDAIRTFRAAYKLDRDNPIVARSMANFGEPLNFWERIFTALKIGRLIGFDHQPGKEDADIETEQTLVLAPDVLFAQSQEMAASGRHVEALEVLREVLALDPERMDVLQTVGQIQSHLGKHKEAIETFRAAENIAPDDENVAVSLIGQIMAVDGSAAGIEPCVRFLERQPENIALLKMHANLLAGAERHKEALGVLGRVVALEPKNLDALATMGQIQAHLEMHSEAVLTFRAAFKIDPDNQIVLSSLIGQTIEADGPGAALELCASVLEQQPENIVLLQMYANVLASTERHKEALAALERVVELEPENVDALVTMGQIQAHLEMHSEAVQTFRTAFKVDSSNELVATSLAGLLVTVAQPGAAIEVCREILRIHPDLVAIWHTLGRAQWQQKDVDVMSMVLATHGETTQTEGLGAEIPSDSLDSTAPGDFPTTSEANLDSAGILDVARGRIADLVRRNEKLAEQVASRVDQIGMREALSTSGSYAQAQYYLRTLSLYVELFGEASELPEASRTIPSSLVEAFGMQGRVPIETGYPNASYPKIYRDTYTDQDLDRFANLFSRTKDLSERDAVEIRSYVGANNETDGWVEKALRSWGIDGRSIAVFNSPSPFYEGLCIKYGAAPTSVHRRGVICRSERLATITLDEWDTSGQTYDGVLAISVVDQEGFGLSGEPLDPDGDLEAMRFFRRMLKPGGRLFLSVPIGVDRVLFNLSRIYGEVRLPVLLDGWKLIERIGYSDELLTGEGEARPLFILENN